MKIGELEIPEELAYLVAGRSEKDLAGVQVWVMKARASKLTDMEMRETLVKASGWASSFVDWYLAVPAHESARGAPVESSPAAAAPTRGYGKIFESVFGRARISQSPAETILIPEGEFIMGGMAAREGPKRKVYLDAYRIGKNPVTVGEFKAYCAAAKVDFRKFPAPGWGWKDDHPMVNANWQQARDYCRWAGGDLPTEAQWEKAARGTNGREYPWGDKWDPALCHCSKKTWGDAKSTSAVGSFPSGASPFGCLDMAGNVWEWCLDWFADSYGGHPNRNPTGPTSGTRRVLRGGAWDCYGHEYFHSAYRDFDDPATQDFHFGFRLAGPP